VLADECNGFYCAGGQPESIYYEENTLVLNVLFKNEGSARHFRITLEKKALNFGFVSSVSVSESYEEVVLPTRAKEIRATHYVHGESHSPQHSLAMSDYASEVDDEDDEVTACDASDAYHILQMSENPYHLFLSCK
jgi:hypothetical protein